MYNGYDTYEDWAKDFLEGIPRKEDNVTKRQLYLMAKYVGYEEDLMYNCTENIGTTESIMKDVNNVGTIVKELNDTVFDGSLKEHDFYTENYPEEKYYDKITEMGGRCIVYPDTWDTPGEVVFDEYLYDRAVIIMNLDRELKTNFIKNSEKITDMLPMLKDRVYAQKLAEAMEAINDNEVFLVKKTELKEAKQIIPEYTKTKSNSLQK